MRSPQLIRCADPDALAERAAELAIAAVARAIMARGQCRIALSGGSTPRKLHACLAARKDSIEWPRVHVFWGDERAVPADDDASNYRMARETLVDHAPIRPEHVHRIETELGAEKAAARYAEVIGTEPLDVVLLGMGDDGHCASLFPDTEGLQSLRGVVVTRSPVPPPERISLALDVINRSRLVMLLVAGATKAARLRQAWDEWHQDIERATLPVAMVRPRGGGDASSPGELVWLVDEAAAQQLGAST